jgi:hypothetical protein
MPVENSEARAVEGRSHERIFNSLGGKICCGLREAQGFRPEAVMLKAATHQTDELTP